MERYLTSGTEIKLKGIDGRYIIKDIIGRGSSCVVYSADFYNANNEKTEHLLKEFNPRCIDLKRGSDGLTPVNEDEKELLESLCNRFKEGFERQAALRTIPELKNYTANIQNTYYDKGTIYIDMTETNGKSYAEVDEKSIYNLAQRIKVLAQVIGNYHKHGYFHLDIKPSNIFVRPEDETCQDVLLFDFDSLVPFSEENGKCVIDENISVSYTTEYAPIELLTSTRRGRICKATDIYEIGEIFFEKLMGRHSTALEHNVWSDYEYNRSAQIYENVNPKVIPLLDELFTHTLCNDVNMRYQSTDEMVDILDKIIKIADTEKPFLKSSLPNVSGFFIGRDAEIKEIYKRLQENNVLFLSGIGGIGKSELAKHYAKKYESEYDAIIFAPFVNDIQMMVADDNYVQIHNFFQYPEEKPNEYFERKMQEFAKLCNERTLIIVDNFDTIKDKNLSRLLSLNCKILITTRRDFTESYPDSQLDVGTLTNPFKVFDEHYKKPLSVDERTCVDEIIEIVDGHTMTVELLAKQMMAGRVKPKKMLGKLKSGGISESGKEKVSHANEKGEISRENTYDHIQALFDLSNLDEDEKYVLANLSLIPHTGISAELFGEWCEIEDFDTINNLAIEGWIRWDREKDYISLHTVCAGVCNNICLTSEYVTTFANNMYLFLLNNEIYNMNEIAIYAPLFTNISKVLIRYNIWSYKISCFINWAGCFLEYNTSYVEYAEDIIDKALTWDVKNIKDTKIFMHSVSHYLSILRSNEHLFGNNNRREERIEKWVYTYKSICIFADDEDSNEIGRIISLDNLMRHYQNMEDCNNFRNCIIEILQIHKKLSVNDVEEMLLSKKGCEALSAIATAYDNLGEFSLAKELYEKIIHSPYAASIEKEVAYTGLLAGISNIPEECRFGLELCEKYWGFLKVTYPPEHKEYIWYYLYYFMYCLNSLCAEIENNCKDVLPQKIFDVLESFQKYFLFREKYLKDLNIAERELISGFAHVIAGYVLHYMIINHPNYDGEEFWPEMNSHIAKDLLIEAKKLFEIVENYEETEKMSGYLDML